MNQDQETSKGFKVFVGVFKAIILLAFLYGVYAALQKLGIIDLIIKGVNLLY